MHIYAFEAATYYTEHNIKRIQHYYGTPDHLYLSYIFQQILVHPRQTNILSISFHSTNHPHYVQIPNHTSPDAS